MRISTEQRQQNEARIRDAIDRLLAGDIPRPSTVRSCPPRLDAIVMRGLARTVLAARRSACGKLGLRRIEA